MKELAVLAICFACFVGGASLQKNIDDRDLATTVAQARERMYAERKSLEEAYAKTIAERDKELAQAYADSNSLRSSIERMRRAASASGVSKANADTRVDYEASVAECKRLLIEGAELLREGAEALRANAADHDALGKMIGEKLVEQ